MFSFFEWSLGSGRGVRGKEFEYFFNPATFQPDYIFMYVPFSGYQSTVYALHYSFKDSSSLEQKCDKFFVSYKFWTIVLSFLKQELEKYQQKNVVVLQGCLNFHYAIDERKDSQNYILI